MIRVLFVCLGNICRSPMADAIFRNLVAEAGLQDSIEIDSAGTDEWHIGEKPHPGTRWVLAAHNIQYRHRARQVTRFELGEWDYLIAMDVSNLRVLRRLTGNFTGEMGLLLDYAPELGVREVPDPYPDWPDPFDKRLFQEVYALVERGCRALLEHIREKEGI